MPELTITITKSTKPQPGKRVVVWDSKLSGFGFRRFPSGKGSFVIFYRNRAGIQRWMTVGAEGTTTVAEARSTARRLLAAAADLRDPLAELEQEREKAKAAITVATYWDRFAELGKAKWKPRTAKEYGRIWDSVLKPALAKKELAEVSRQVMAGLHTKMASTPYEANRALAVARSLFSEACREGLMATNPAKGIRAYREKAREAMLNARQLRAIFEAMDAEEGKGVSPFATSLFRLLLHTGARCGELMGCRWEWVDSEAGVIRLPDSKTGAKTIVLTEAASAEIARLRTMRTVGSPWLVEGRREGEHMSDPHRAWVRIRERAADILTAGDGPEGEAEAVRKFRIHDSRHAYASYLVAAGVSLYTVGKLLGHANPATTARYSHLAEDPLRQAANTAAKVITDAIGPTVQAKAV